MSLPVRLLLGFALVHAGFATLPAIDLWVAGLFFDGTGFPLEGRRDLHRLRYGLWYGSVAVGLAALALWPLWRLAGPQRRVPPRIWGFAGLCFLLGPGLLVDLVLKAHWGRARPGQIIEFGGTQPFTPPFEIAGACARNCSFVSGEAAVAAMLAIVAGTLAWPHLGRRGRLGLASLLAAWAALAALLRVAMGRHFLSDAVFAAFLMGFVALGLYRLLRIDWALPALTQANLAHDLRLMARRLGRWPSRTRGCMGEACATRPSLAPPACPSPRCTGSATTSSSSTPAGARSW